MPTPQPHRQRNCGDTVACAHTPVWEAQLPCTHAALPGTHPHRSSHIKLSPAAPWLPPAHPTLPVSPSPCGWRPWGRGCSSTWGAGHSHVPTMWTLIKWLSWQQQLERLGSSSGVGRMEDRRWGHQCPHPPSTTGMCVTLKHAHTDTDTCGGSPITLTPQKPSPPQGWPYVVTSDIGVTPLHTTGSLPTTQHPCHFLSPTHTLFW